MRFKELLFSIVLSCFFIPVGASEEDCAIRVELSTEQSLVPLYVTRFQVVESRLTDDYIERLYQILRSDFACNGRNALLAADGDKEKMAKNPTQRLDHKLWGQLGVRHVLYPSIEDDQLCFVLFIASTGEVKEMQKIPLTGTLSSDRRILHRCADKVHMMLFNENGIASRRVLFSLQKPSEESARTLAEIYQVDLDGSNMKQVTREHNYCITPVTLPYDENLSNDQFLYVSYRLGQPKIYMAPLKGGTGKRFVDLRGNQMLPAITMQRDKIAFICDAGGRADLFLQRLIPDGDKWEKPVQLFSFPRSTQASPTFSPDGNQLAFVSDKDGTPRIYLMPARVDATRKEAILLTKQNRQSTCPAWSPDGSKLAYSAKTDGIRQLWIYDFSTGDERQLTFGPGNKENPVWAPNSLHLLFNTNDPHSSELFLVNLNQSQVKKISTGEGRKHFPVWR